MFAMLRAWKAHREALAGQLDMLLSETGDPGSAITVEERAVTAARISELIAIYDRLIGHNSR